MATPSDGPVRRSARVMQSWSAQALRRASPPPMVAALVSSAALCAGCTNARWPYMRGTASTGSPVKTRTCPLVLHQVGHVAMGLAILDNADIEAVRAACDRHERRVFLLVVAPLPLEGATGCAVNPIAIF